MNIINIKGSIRDGSIRLDSMKCMYCDNSIYTGNADHKCICTKCAAIYMLINRNIIEDKVEVEYKFKNFGCMEGIWTRQCDGPCLMPRSYCKNHSDDLSIKRAENTIKSMEMKVNEAKETLEKIKESKKIWIVSKLSGIENE